MHPARAKTAVCLGRCIFLASALLHPVQGVFKVLYCSRDLHKCCCICVSFKCSSGQMMILQILRSSLESYLCCVKEVDAASNCRFEDLAQVILQGQVRLSLHPHYNQTWQATKAYCSSKDHPTSLKDVLKPFCVSPHCRQNLCYKSRPITSSTAA